MKKQYKTPAMQEISLLTGDICALSGQPLWTVGDNGNDNMQDWTTWRDR